MASPIHIASSSQFKQLLASTTIVVTDFYADWCGPCKQIAPEYESLSKKYSSPKTVAFAKVNVDQQQGIAQQYSVRAMPTFIIFKSGSPVETVKGADRGALAAAIDRATRGAQAAKPSYTFSASQGHTLGGGRPKGSLSRPAFNPQGFLQAVVAFFGLYVYSLFAFDAYSAAEASPFNMHRVDMPAAKAGTGGARTGAATQVGKKLGTISDFGGN